MESKCQNGVENPQAGRLLTCLQSLGSEEDTETAAPSVVKIVRLIFVLGQDIGIVTLHRIITKKLIRKTESWSHLRHPKRALVIPTFASLCDSCDVFLARHSIRSLETGSNCAWRTGTGTDLMTMDISVTTPGEVVQVWSLTQFYSVQLAFHNKKTRSQWKSV